jgi:hypothetical protein
MPKQTEEQILFPEKTIGGIVVRPWSFGQLFDVSEPLERVLDKVEDSGLADKLIDPDSGEINLSYVGLARLFTVAGPELLNVISKTLDVGEDELRKLSIKDGVSILLLMYHQNKEMIVGALKNAFSPPQKEETKLKKAIKAKKVVGKKKKATE